jgi:hypothetical protein
MSVAIKVKRGTAAAWTTADLVLAAGEMGFETDTLKTKHGDGTTAWTSLPYSKAEADVPDASTTDKGIIEIATDAEAAAGTDTTKAVTPKQLADATEITEIDGGIVS